MPALTVCESPKGLPIATTQSPTLIASESPSGSARRSFASMRTTAMSVCGSVPTTLPGNSRSSDSLTWISSAPSTTWLFVRTMPFLSTTKPVPSPCTSPVGLRRWVKGETSISSPTVVIVTTLGSAACAIGAKLTGSRRTLTEPTAGGGGAGVSGGASLGTGVAPGGMAPLASSPSVPCGR